MNAAITDARVERTVAEVRRIAHAGLDGVEILRRTAQAVNGVVPIDAYCASTADPATGLMTGGYAGGLDVRVPDIGRVSRRFFERVYFEEQIDLVRAMVRRGEHVVTPAEALGLPPAETLRYREVLQPLGFAPEAALVFTDNGFWGGMELMRAGDGRAFSTGELAILKRIAPVVGPGLRAAALRARAATATAADGPGVLVVDPAGRAVSATPAARGLLAELHGGIAGWIEEPPLPVPVMMVLGDLAQAMRPGAAGVAAVRPPRLRVRSRRGRWLSIHADLVEARDGLPNDRVVVIAPAPAAEVAWLDLAAHALSPREEEVVRLVVAGLSTRQMADRLFIAEHTVQRHLSNIFEKVGVRSRRELVKRFFTEQVMPALA